MGGMSENAPEPALNGHGGPAAGSAALAEAGQEVAAHAAAAGQAEALPERQPAMIDDLCRLTVCGPGRTVELAVPVHVPLIDLLPALVGHLGDGLADAGLEHGGWVLQRLGDPPLREELSVSALGLHDGDVVHLRPRADQLPPLDFDDLIDGVATGISGRPDRWRPEMSRRLLTGLIAAPLAAGLVILAGQLSPLADLAAGALTVVLLGLTAAASRGLGDRLAASVLGGGAICYAGLAGAEFTLVRAGRSGHVPITAAALRPAVLAGAAAIAGACVAVSMLRGGRHPALLGSTLAAVLVTLGGALATLARLDAASVAGILLAIMMPLGGWVPMMAFRLAKMRLDPTPGSPEELQADLDPVPGQLVLDQTRLADRYMAALYAGLAVVVAACLVILSLAAGLAAHVVELDVIVLLLLHSRALVAARHRMAVIAPAIVGAATLLAVTGLRADTRAWPVVVALAGAAAALFFALERSLPEHRLLPHWGRVGDLLHTLTAAALIPAVLWLVNFYEFARTVHG
jgi:type VII secretion integral membrane protein EccD